MLLSGFLSRTRLGFRFEVVHLAAREAVCVLENPSHTQWGEPSVSPCNVKADDKGAGRLGVFRESLIFQSSGYMSKMSTFKYHFKD